VRVAEVDLVEMVVEKVPAVQMEGMADREEGMAEREAGKADELWPRRAEAPL